MTKKIYEYEKNYLEEKKCTHNGLVLPSSPLSPSSLPSSFSPLPSSLQSFFNPEQYFLGSSFLSSLVFDFDFNLEETVKDWPLDSIPSKDKGVFMIKHYLCTIVSDIAVNQYMKGNSDINDVSIPLPTSIMYRFFGGRTLVPKLIEYLINRGFIRMARNYSTSKSKGPSCRTYQIIKENLGEMALYDLDLWTKDYMNGKPWIAKERNPQIRLLAYLSEQRKDTESICPEFRSRFVFESFEEHYKSLRMGQGARERLNSVRDDYEKGVFLAMSTKVVNIDENNNCGFFHPRTRRYYNSFITLRKDLREFATFDGETIFEADVKCSQPFILKVLYDTAYLTKGVESEELKKERASYEKFLTGDVYMSLWDKKCQTFNDLTAIGDREKAKKRFMQLVFGEVWRGKDGEVVGKCDRRLLKTIDSEFPILTELIFRHKAKHGYKELSVLLQQLEADAVFDSIDNYFGNLKGEHMRFLTIHDAVLCLEQHVEGIAEELKRVYEQRFGGQVNVKKNRLTAC